MKLFCMLLIVLFAMPAMAQISTYEVDLSLPPTNDYATSLASNLVKDTVVSKKEFFCVKGELTCRTHYTLSDKNGNPIRAFYVKFVAVERSTGSQGYFFPVKGSDDQFVRFEDFSFDGQLNINHVVTENIVAVTKNERNRVTKISGLIVPVLGTTQYVAADLIVDALAATLVGTRYDSTRPEYSEPYMTIYKRNSL